MTERKTIRRWFWIWEFEREEQWLNVMAQSGWVLDKVGFSTFHFVACEPGAYTVRLEMHQPDDEYVNFMQETDAEYVGRMAQWIYFRKKVEDGPFEIFSDLDSRIRHLDKIGKALWGIGLANLIIGLCNTINPVLNIGWLNLLCATFLMYALGRIHGQKARLELDRQLRE